MKFRLFIMAALAALLASCSVSGTDVGLTSPDGHLRLKVSPSENAAAAPSLDNTALTLSWSSDNGVKVTAVELSADKQFVGPYSQSVNSGVSECKYTFRELNDILISALAMKTGIRTSLYVRLVATFGSATVYSNVITVTVTPGTTFNAPVLSSSTSEIVLYASTPKKLAISLSWTRNGLNISNAVEMSSDESFSEPYFEVVSDGVYDVQYTYGRLNEILVGSLGMSPDTQSILYIRIASQFGTEQVYSNVLPVTVTPEAAGSAGGLGDKLYVAGLRPGDDWTFDDYLVIYNNEYMGYGGVHYVDSKWGYRLYPELDNWDYYYTMAAGGNGLGGALTLGGEGNIWAPDKGLYLFDVSIGGYSYKLTAVNSVSYAGINDDWTMRRMTPSPDDPTVFTATVNKTAASPYGFQVLVNDDWKLNFGAADGGLLLYHEGKASGNDVANGTYVLTVNLGTGTYTYTPAN